MTWTSTGHDRSDRRSFRGSVYFQNSAWENEESLLRKAWHGCACFIGHDGADANSQHILNLSGGSMVWTHRHPGALACGLLLFFANQMITRSYSILNIHICHLYFFYKYTYIYIYYIYITDFDCILIYIVYVSLQPCAAAESRESTTIMWVLGGVYDCMIGLKHHEFDIIE